MKQLYKIKLSIDGCKLYNNLDGYLMNESCDGYALYTRGEAIKKARMFCAAIEEHKTTLSYDEPKVLFINYESLSDNLQVYFQGLEEGNGLFEMDAIIFLLDEDAHEFDEFTINQIHELRDLMFNYDYFAINFK